MEQQKKIDYLKMALAMQNIASDDFVCDSVITTYEKIIELEGEFSLRDAATIKAAMDEKYCPKKTKHKKRGYAKK
jgi:hypothetical protein